MEENKPQSQLLDIVPVPVYSFNASFQPSSLPLLMAFNGNAAPFVCAAPHMPLNLSAPIFGPFATCESQFANSLGVAPPTQSTYSVGNNMFASGLPQTPSVYTVGNNMFTSVVSPTPSIYNVENSMSTSLGPPPQSMQSSENNMFTSLAPSTSSFYNVENSMSTSLAPATPSFYNFEHSMPINVLPPPPLTISTSPEPATPPSYSFENNMYACVPPSVSSTENVENIMSTSILPSTQTTQDINNNISTILLPSGSSTQNVENNISTNILPSTLTTKGIENNISTNILPPPASTTQSVENNISTNVQPPTLATQSVENNISESDSLPIYLKMEFPEPMPPPPFDIRRFSSNEEEVASMILQPNSTLYSPPEPIVMNDGTIKLQLRFGITVDITEDKALRLINERRNVTVTVGRDVRNVAMTHPNGRLMQNPTRVELITFDGKNINSFVRYAKLFREGIVFKNKSSDTAYFIDSNTVRPTSATFADHTVDYNQLVFDDSRHGPHCVEEAKAVVRNYQFEQSASGGYTYHINGFVITQDGDGFTQIQRPRTLYMIRTCPRGGSLSLTTPRLHCTASIGKTSHMFVRSFERRMHTNCRSFVVRCAGNAAGYNEIDEFVAN